MTTPDTVILYGTGPSPPHPSPSSIRVGSQTLGGDSWEPPRPILFPLPLSGLGMVLSSEYLFPFRPSSLPSSCRSSHSPTSLPLIPSHPVCTALLWRPVSEVSTDGTEKPQTPTPKVLLGTATCTLELATVLRRPHPTLGVQGVVSIPTEGGPRPPPQVGGL